jgi:hypothetical protein
MTEQELVEMMYKKHKKLLLTMEEAAKEWGSSYSKVSKLFGGKNALPEKFILDNKIVPCWTMLGTKRMWKLIDIAKWILNTEEIL